MLRGDRELPCGEPRSAIHGSLRYLLPDCTAEEALAQIDAKGYGIPYEADGREVVKVGVEFDKATRNLGRWLVA